MPNLTVEGSGTVDVGVNRRLVLAIEQDAHVDILHACGGFARCTTCRVEFIDGELGIVVDGKAQSAPMSREQQLQFYREVRGYAQLRNKKDGWAYHACQAKGINAPWSWKSYEPLEPSPAVAAWCRSRLIAYAKSRGVT